MNNVKFSLSFPILKNKRLKFIGSVFAGFDLPLKHFERANGKVACGMAEPDFKNPLEWAYVDVEWTGLTLKKTTGSDVTRRACANGKREKYNGRRLF